VVLAVVGVGQSCKDFNFVVNAGCVVWLNHGGVGGGVDSLQDCERFAACC